MSAAAARWQGQCAGSLATVIRSEIDVAKALIYSIDDFQYGSDVGSLLDAVRSTIRCFDQIALDIDPACDGVVSDCLHEINVELRSVRSELSKVSPKG